MTKLHMYCIAADRRHERGTSVHTLEIGFAERNHRANKFLASDIALGGPKHDPLETLKTQAGVLCRIKKLARITGSDTPAAWEVRIAGVSSSYEQGLGQRS